MDTLWLKFRVLCSSSFSEDDQEGDVEEGIKCPLKKYESFVAFKLVEWIGGSIVRFHLWHLEST